MVVYRWLDELDELLLTRMFHSMDSEPVTAAFGHILLGVGHARLAGALEALEVGLCRTWSADDLGAVANLLAWPPTVRLRAFRLRRKVSWRGQRLAQATMAAKPAA